MKVILYMATTINGFIAKPDDNTDWISQTEWNSYSAMVQKTGAMIIGHRTYDILTKQDGFTELQKVKIVVISNIPFKTLADHHLTARTPKEALEFLKDFPEVIVAGGGILNTAFIKEGLIDEIYLDIEPLAFGKGILLFMEADFEFKLKLLEINKLSDNTIQLHYQILK